MSAILPLLTFAFLGLAFGLIFDWPVQESVAAFLLITLGLLLIPAMTLRGDATLNDEGLTFRSGRQTISATWAQVSGLVYRPDCGICIHTRGQTQSPTVIKAPGGLSARDGEGFIPVRYFGDRRFAIMYEIRDHIPDAAWRRSLDATQPDSALHPRFVYALAVAFSILSVAAVVIAQTR